MTGGLVGLAGLLVIGLAVYLVAALLAPEAYT